VFKKEKKGKINYSRCILHASTSPAETSDITFVASS
jgi:hypothetical protein